MAEGEDSLRDLQFEVATMTVERNAWYNQAAEAMEKLNAAEASVALQSTLWEAARDDMNTHTAEMAELQKKLTAKKANLSRI